jgi:hypothetical protein
MTLVEPYAPVLGLPPGDPTFAGFQWFVANMAGIPASEIPDVTVLQACYDQAINLAYWGLETVPSQSTSPSIYAFAVYNLATDILVEIAWDDPNGTSTYWTDLRNKLGLNSMNFGIITSATDQGTSESTFIPDQIKGMTLMDLQLAKTPWGRRYLMFAGQWGAIWGITF